LGWDWGAGYGGGTNVLVSQQSVPRLTQKSVANVRNPTAGALRPVTPCGSAGMSCSQRLKSGGVTAYESGNDKEVTSVWVKSRHRNPSSRCPHSLQKRTSTDALAAIDPLASSLKPLI
jgi:hypothetical protein